MMMMIKYVIHAISKSTTIVQCFNSATVRSLTVPVPSLDEGGGRR